MKQFLPPFKFPKRLWLIISAAAFLYLVFTVRLLEPGKAPINFTAWKALVDGYIVFGLIASLSFLVFGVAFGAFVAVILCNLRDLLWKSKGEPMQTPPDRATGPLFF